MDNASVQPWPAFIRRGSIIAWNVHCMGIGDDGTGLCVHRDIIMLAT